MRKRKTERERQRDRKRSRRRIALYKLDLLLLLLLERERDRDRQTDRQRHRETKTDQTETHQKQRQIRKRYRQRKKKEREAERIKQTHRKRVTHSEKTDRQTDRGTDKENSLRPARASSELSLRDVIFCFMSSISASSLSCVRDSIAVCFYSKHLPQMLETEFESWLGLKFSSFSMWHFLTIFIGRLLWIHGLELEFPSSSMWYFLMIFIRGFF